MAKKAAPKSASGSAGKSAGSSSSKTRAATKGEIYGGAVAAPAFQQIVAFALPYLGIDPK